MKVYTHKIKYEDEEKCCTLDNHRLETKMPRQYVLNSFFPANNKNQQERANFR